METLHRISLRLLPLSISSKTRKHTCRFRTHTISQLPNQTRHLIFHPVKLNGPSYSSSSVARAGWLLGLGGDSKKKLGLPDIVKAGDPVLHEPTQDVDPAEIGSERIQKIIDDMVSVMRKAPGVGLAAPQIGIPLRVSFHFYLILLENVGNYCSYSCNNGIFA